MPIFEYQAIDTAGNQVRGTIVQGSAAEATKILQHRGFVVTGVTAASTGIEPNMPVTAPRPAPVIERPQQPPQNPALVGAKPVVFSPRGVPNERSALAIHWSRAFNGIKLDHHYFFFRQFAHLVDAGISISDALDSLSRQTRNRRYQQVAREMRAFTMEGISLAAVMARYEDIFSPLMIAMVNAGERGGFLSRALMDTARYVEQDIELRNLIRRETMYPKIVLAFACVLVPAVNLIISLVAPGSPFGLSSPLTTPKNWIVYGPVLAFVFLFWRVGLNIPSIRSVWDTIWTPFPGIGRTMREFAMARFGRAFGAMYRGGLPHPESLVLAADTCGNEYLRSKIYSAEQPLRNGQSITEAMKATNVFDWAVIDMVATGERTGNIDFMLLKMAEYYEQEAAIRARKLGMWLGILVFVIVAIYVFYIVLNFYLSYFSTVMGGAN